MHVLQINDSVKKKEKELAIFSTSHYEIINFL
jgi:hypothetical protein